MKYLQLEHFKQNSFHRTFYTAQYILRNTFCTEHFTHMYIFEKLISNTKFYTLNLTGYILYSVFYTVTFTFYSVYLVYTFKQYIYFTQNIYTIHLIPNILYKTYNTYRTFYSCTLCKINFKLYILLRIFYRVLFT